MNRQLVILSPEDGMPHDFFHPNPAWLGGLRPCPTGVERVILRNREQALERSLDLPDDVPERRHIVLVERVPLIEIGSMIVEEVYRRPQRLELLLEE